MTIISLPNWYDFSRPVSRDFPHDVYGRQPFRSLSSAASEGITDAELERLRPELIAFLERVSSNWDPALPRLTTRALLKTAQTNGWALDPFGGVGPAPPTPEAAEPQPDPKPVKPSDPIDLALEKIRRERAKKKPAGIAGAAPLAAPQAHLDAVLDEMNAEHCIISNYGSRVRVMSWDRSGDFEVPIFQSFDDFKNRYAGQWVPGGKKPRTRAEYWLKHPHHRQYEGLVMRPESRHVQLSVDNPFPDPRYFNLWRGFAVLPKRGDWSLMQDHIFDVLACGDQAVADYIFGWAAWAVQNPDKPAEAVLVLLGDEGTGKGVFFRALGKVFGPHFSHISNVDHMTGKHNRHLMHTIFLFADEAYWPGDKRGEGALKRLVTEDTITIEPKGVNSFQVPNLLHIGMASNNDWAVPASAHARRFMVQRTSDRWSRQNSAEAERLEYFQALYGQMYEDGGIQAMLWDLLNMDLGDWHPRQIIETAGLADQKQQSLPPEDSWFQDVLMNGILPGDQEGDGWTPCQILFEHYIANGKKRGAGSRHADQTRLGTRLTQKLGAIKRDCTGVFERPLRGGETEKVRYRGVYEFPSLAETRAKFEHETGTRPRWTSPEIDWLPDVVEYKETVFRTGSIRG